MEKTLKHKNAKYINYKEVKKRYDRAGVDIDNFHQALKNGEMTVLARHPETGRLQRFRISKIHEDGKVEGCFLDE